MRKLRFVTSRQQIIALYALSKSIPSVCVFIVIAPAKLGSSCRMMLMMQKLFPAVPGLFYTFQALIITAGFHKPGLRCGADILDCALAIAIVPLLRLSHGGKRHKTE